MARNVERTQISVGPQGRVVIPAKMRRELGIEAGDTLVARVEGARIVFEKHSETLARVKRRFDAVPGDVILADELVSERREEARRESEES
ncbi:MAG: AbrB/MazE/SpoVT family DNA-binding domain-containing protein [Rubrobacter sp.]|jgi:AbrB family looped-hinge helix DNA binding protein|nr:AbrB/MazE/SpoVT family DNA-binding domain-containing protein [Rubrobacter sp.]